MDILLSAAGAAVWFVFLGAGLRKLRDTQGTAAAMRGFGLPDATASLLAPVLPWVELAVAAMLLLPALAWPGAWVATGLLTVFTALIVAALLRGQRPSCNCFGSASAKPISWATAARNALLLVMGLVLLTQGGGRLDAGLVNLWAATARDMATPTAALLIVAGIAAAQTVVIAKLFAQQGRMLLRMDNLEHGLAQIGRDSVTHSAPAMAMGPPVGALAPDFSGMALRGGETIAASQHFASQREWVMLFVGPECAPCHEVLAWIAKQRPVTPVLVVTSGSPALNKRILKGTEQLTILIQNGQQAQDLYGVIGTPSAVRIRDSRIDSATAIGLAPIQSLFELDSAPSLAIAAAAGNV